MTVSSETNRVVYVGAGLTGPFAVPFYFLEDDDLKVIKTLIAAPFTETTLILNTDYTLTGAGVIAGGGALNLTAGHGPLAATHNLSIIRDPDSLQGLDLQPNDPFPADSVERALDKLSMRDQRFNDLLARSLKLSDGDTTGISGTLPSPVASAVLAINAARTAFVWALQAGVLAVSAFGQSLLNTVDRAAAWVLLGLNSESLWCGNAGGTANALTLTPAPASAGYAAGQSFVFKATATNTGAVTIAVSGGGAKAGQCDGNAMVGGEIENNKWHRATYDGAAFQVERLGEYAYRLLTQLTTPVRTADFIPIFDVATKLYKRLLLEDIPMQLNDITGLTYANGTGGGAGDLVNDITVAVGKARDSADSANMVLAAAITKQLDANWAVGSAAGGRLSGALADGDYNIWLIKRSDTGVVDVGFETVANAAPTLPANYDKSRKIGWFRRTAGSIELFHTYEMAGGGLELKWDVPSRTINQANTLTTARRTDALRCPQQFSTVCEITYLLQDAAASFNFWIGCPDVPDFAPSSSTSTNGISIWNGANQFPSCGQMHVRTSSAGLIAARADIATVDGYFVTTAGFVWSRR